MRYATVCIRIPQKIMGIFIPQKASYTAFPWTRYRLYTQHRYEKKEHSAILSPAQKTVYDSNILC